MSKDQLENDTRAEKLAMYSFLGGIIMLGSII